MRNGLGVMGCWLGSLGWRAEVRQRWKSSFLRACQHVDKCVDGEEINLSTHELLGFIRTCTEGFSLVAGGFFGEETDVVYTTVALGVVHAVADDELVGNLEGYVVGFDGDEAALGFVEAGGDLEGGGLVLEHQAAEIAECEAGVEDVFDDDDVLAFDGVVNVLDELDGAGGDAGAAVAGDGDEVEGVIDADGSGEVGEEDGCAFEYSDEDDRLALVVGGDLGTDGPGALGDLLLSEEDGHGFGGR